jgi:hypothetical protein
MNHIVDVLSSFVGVRILQYDVSDDDDDVDGQNVCVR